MKGGIFSQSVSLTQYVVLCTCLRLSPSLSVPVSFWRGFVDNTIVKQNEDDLKNKDDIKNEDDLKNEDDFKNEDNLKN